MKYRYEYLESKDIYAQGHSFYALVMAAMRQADYNNLILLQSVFPDVWKNLQKRYNSIGGLLEGENDENSL